MSKINFASIKINFLVVGLAIVAVCMPSAAQAADIVVGGDCTLVDAVYAANQDQAVGECSAGEVGEDTIQ